MRHSGPPFSIRHALHHVLAELHASSRAAHRIAQQRHFHDYFVTHLPSSSLAPDKNRAEHHKLPRSDSTPHSGPAQRSNRPPSDRETTIVRIPLKSAKHHFGAGVGRGSRPYNEDTYQAGTVEIPAFAKKQPVSISGRREISQNVGSTRDTGDPQVFYFAVFDGHGGTECSEFLRDRLHGYIEEAALLFGLESSLHQQRETAESGAQPGIKGERDPGELQKSLVMSWKDTVGGYFKRFRPEYFPAVAADDDPEVASSSIETVLTYAFLKADLDFTTAQAKKQSEDESAKEKAAQKALQEKVSIDDPVIGDRPLNDGDMLFHPEREASQNLSTRPAPRGSSPNLDDAIGGKKRFQGGSTASVALISTPTPTPFWHPNSPSTLTAAHVGDTRILLCKTDDGSAVPVTQNHHPSMPVEARRLRRYATSFVTDSFGEERILGLANTRAFGDIGSKRIGVSAEPQITTVHLPPAGYSFIVLMSDGVSGHLDDQEIVDIVKEARTPDQASKDLVTFAVETSADADNATALVVRLGGWERRNEGGNGSLGTKEQRAFRQQEADNPRSRRQ